MAEEITGAVQFPNGISHPAGGVIEWSASCCSRLLVCAVTFDVSVSELCVTHVVLVVACTASELCG
eukprot:3631579-Prymnesium_polylepis.1